MAPSHSTRAISCGPAIAVAMMMAAACAPQSSLSLAYQESAPEPGTANREALEDWERQIIEQEQLAGDVVWWVRPDATWTGLRLIRHDAPLGVPIVNVLEIDEITGKAHGSPAEFRKALARPGWPVRALYLPPQLSWHDGAIERLADALAEAGWIEHEESPRLWLRPDLRAERADLFAEQAGAKHSR